MKILRTFFATLLFFSVIHADAPPEIPASYEKRLKKVEKTLATGYNAPAELASGIFVQGDVLYWTARQEGIAYALKFSGDEFHAKDPQFDWDFGCRVGIGYNTHTDHWSLGVYWTHLFTRARDTGMNNNAQTLIPIWSNPNFTPFPETATSAEASWKLIYNQLDINCARAFYVSKYFILRPSIGPSLLSLDQHYTLNYTRPAFALLPPIPTGYDKVKLKNLFQGVGLNAGCDLLFCFKHGLSLFGRANVGLYYGQFNLRHKEKFIDTLGDKQPFSVKQNLHVGTPATALALGFAWERGFAKNKHAVAIKILWEELIFFDQNQMFRFVSTSPDYIESNYVTNQGDLTLQGGTFSIAITF